MAASDGRNEGRQDEAGEELGRLGSQRGRRMHVHTTGGPTLLLPILTPSHWHVPGDVPVRLDGLGLVRNSLGQTVGPRRGDGRTRL